MTDQPRPLLAITILDAGDHWTVERRMIEGLPIDEACGITQLAVDAALHMHDEVHILDGMRN